MVYIKKPTEKTNNLDKEERSYEPFLGAKKDFIKDLEDKDKDDD